MFLQRRVARIHLPLDLGGALHGVDDAGELGEHVVAGRVHHPSPVAGHGRRDRLPVRGDRADGGDLVVAHQPAVAFDVGAEDGGQLAVHAAPVHAFDSTPPPRAVCRARRSRRDDHGVRAGGRSTSRRAG
jgi:hypothetical protein